MTALRDVTRASERLADAIADHVREALALERERFDADLAELRDEVAEIGLRGGGMSEAVTSEIRYLNERMEKLTQTVAAMMGDPNAEHSMRVAEGWRR